jgi:hypothetical protein
MKPFAEKLREDRRLVLLRLLAEQNGYRCNSSVLHAGLMHLGVAASRDDVVTDLAWLRDQHLLTLDEAVPGLFVARLMARGADVAAGNAIVPGVSRPGPGR